MPGSLRGRESHLSENCFGILFPRGMPIEHPGDVLFKDQDSLSNLEDQDSE